MYSDAYACTFSLSTQLVLDTFDTGFESSRNRIEIKILVSSQPYCIVLHGIWQSRMDEIEQLASMSASYQVPTINREGRGRPQLLISKEQLVSTKFKLLLDAYC